MQHGELAFPGQIIVRQRGTKYHPGYNVGLGKDHTIFATSVGFVKLTHESITYQRVGEGGQPAPRIKERQLVSVVPVNGDWSESYKEVEKEMIAKRAEIKRAKLQALPLEAAFHFPMPHHTPVRTVEAPKQPAKAAAAPAAAAKAQPKKKATPPPS